MKNSDRLANSVDPDEMAPYDLDLHCLHSISAERVNIVARF